MQYKTPGWTNLEYIMAPQEKVTPLYKTLLNDKSRIEENLNMGRRVGFDTQLGTNSELSKNLFSFFSPSLIFLFHFCFSKESDGFLLHRVK